MNQKGLPATRAKSMGKVMVGGSRLEILTENDKEKIINIDPEMKERVIDKGIDLFKIFPNTLFYYYYNDNNELLSHVYAQPPMADSIIHPVLKTPMYGMYYVWAIETIERFRGHGYAQEMLDKNKSYFLRVEKNKKSAIHIYNKFGFKYHKDSGDTEQIMICEK